MDHAVMSSDPPAAPPVPGPDRLDSAQAGLRSHLEPETVRSAFAPAGTLAEAEAYTRWLARSHYENFSVISFLLPKRLRQDFCNVYAFCRTADDLADEVGDRRRASDYLACFRDETHACYAGSPNAQIFKALGETVRRHQIPIQPFLDLIDAFEQDQRIDRYQTFGELLEYCRRSADPVGRLVLYVCGYRDPERQRLSDRTCSALQLANFWQDVRRDLLDRDRIYIPAESMRRFGVSEQQIREGIRMGRCDDNFRELMRFELERTEAMFREGEALLPMLAPAVRQQIGLFGKGGRAIVQTIRRQNYDTLSRRPALSRWQKGRLVVTALLAYAARSFPPGWSTATSGAKA